MLVERTTYDAVFDFSGQAAFENEYSHELNQVRKCLRLSS